MTKNEFIIGLGGIGGRSISEFRKALKLHKQDEAKLIEDGYAFEYLYIDSNNDIYDNKDRYWNAYGENFSLSPTDFIHLRENLGDSGTIDALSQLDNVSPWFGNFRREFAKNQGKEETDEAGLNNSIATINGAGQLRRLGRILYALHAHTIQRKIKEKFDNLTNKGYGSDMNIRIFCTLGGGTGSGSIVDTVTLLRTMAKKDGISCKIIIYPYIVGLGSGVKFNTGSAYENQYAALRDLNALMVHSYRPYMADTNSDGRFHGEDPIHAIVLSSEMSEPRREIDDQIVNMTNACLDSIIYGFSGGSNSNCLKAFTFEDLQSSMAEPSATDAKRSYRFSTYGTKRWCVPTEQLKNLLKADYETRVMDSLLNGTELPKGTARDLSNFGMTYELSESGTVKTMESLCEEAMSELDQWAENARETEDRNPDLLSSLAKMTETWEAQAKNMNGRNDVLGKITQYYRADSVECVRRIQNAADEKIKWTASIGRESWGLKDIEKRLLNLSNEVNEWAEAPDYKLYTPDEEKEKRDTIVRCMKKRAEQWEKLGWLTIKCTSKARQMLDNHIEDAKALIELSLRPFKHSVMQTLSKTVYSDLSAFRSKVKQAIEAIEKQKNQTDAEVRKIYGGLTANTSYAGDGVGSNGGDLFELDKENLDKVRDLIKTNIICKNAHQAQMADIFCDRWSKIIGELSKYTSTLLNRYVKDIQEDLYKASEEIEKRACEQDSSLHSVLVSSIFDRLHQITSESDPELAFGAKVRNLVGTMGGSIRINPSNGLKIKDGKASPARAIIVGLPSLADKHPELKEWLKGYVKSSLTGLLAGCEVGFYTHHTEGEIRILYVQYWLPARFAPVISQLHDRYVETSRSNGISGLIYFANIDDDDIGLNSKNRPSLLPENEGDKTKVRRIEFAKQLFGRHGEKVNPIVNEQGNQVILLLGIDNEGLADYSKEYSIANLEIPTPEFMELVNAAIRFAKESMTDEDKQSVIQAQIEKYRKLTEEDGVSSADPKARQIREKIEEYRKWLDMA